jgi:chloride channel 7
LHRKAFQNDREKMAFVSCGAAAGVSVAFGAPIGGVLFSLEEGSSFWDQMLTWRSFFCSMVAMFVANFFLSGFKEGGSWGNLNEPGMFTFGDFNLNEEASYSAYELPAFILIGVFGGLFGALYNYLNKRLTLFRRAHLTERGVRLAEALIISLAVSIISFALPYVWRNECLKIPDDSDYESTFVQFYCDEGEYNELATLYFTPSENAIKQLFHARHTFKYLNLSLFFASYFMLSCWTYGIAVPSGLFVPNLLAGAAFGRIVGQLLQHLFGKDDVVNAGTYALVGAASGLSGMARMLISLAVILIEATGDIQYGLPLMVSLMAAKWVGDYFNEGLYDIHIDINHWPILEWNAPRDAAFLLAQNVMNRINPRTVVREVERVGTLYDLFADKSHNHNAFLVLGGAGGVGERTLKGLLLRKHLAVLLNTPKCFAEHRPQPYITHCNVTLDELEAPYPRFPKPEDIALSATQRDRWIDLTPFMDPTPAIIPAHAPAPRVFHVFRTLGLRHLVVIPRHSEPLGMIPRKDLTHHACARHLDRLFEPAPTVINGGGTGGGGGGGAGGGGGSGAPGSALQANGSDSPLAGLLLPTSFVRNLDKNPHTPVQMPTVAEKQASSSTASSSQQA